jgi:hypothetical protein
MPSILLVEMGLINFLPGLASNCYSANFCLQSGWDYRYELQCLASFLLRIYVCVYVYIYNLYIYKL